MITICDFKQQNNYHEKTTKQRTVYTIVCDKTGRKYIGSTEDANKRKKQHFVALRNNRHKNQVMQYDFKKFGEDSFEFLIVGNYEEKTAFHIEYLLMYLYETRNPNKGYNYLDRNEINSDEAFFSEAEILKKESAKRGITILELFGRGIAIYQPESNSKMYDEYAKIRDEKGLTDYKVAKMVGITTANISHWKLGRSELKFGKLVAIADCLGVSVEVFADVIRKEKQ